MGLDNRVSIKKYDTQKEEVTTMGAPVNRVGEIYGSLKIIEELGGNRIICKCIIHESINEYDKSRVVKGQTHCKHCAIQKKQVRKG